MALRKNVAVYKDMYETKLEEVLRYQRKVRRFCHVHWVGVSQCERHD